jgi:quercetin dioxygenase-like cupin family protein
MKLLKIHDALKSLERVNDEIRYKSCIEEKEYTVGLIAFSPRTSSDVKQINHHDKDVVCQVLHGRGRLRLQDEILELEPGTLCHVPRGTPHDFSAGHDGELVLLYSLMTTGKKK